MKATVRDKGIALIVENTFPLHLIMEISTAALYLQRFRFLKLELCSYTCVMSFFLGLYEKAGDMNKLCRFIKLYEPDLRVSLNNDGQ